MLISEALQEFLSCLSLGILGSEDSKKTRINTFAFLKFLIGQLILEKNYDVPSCKDFSPGGTELEFVSIT